MKKGLKIALIAIAALLIAGGIAGIVYYIISDKAPADEPKKETVHPPVEYFYYEDGNIKSEVYYDNDVYVGKTDYFTSDNKEYVMHFDKDNNEIGSTVTEKDSFGNVTMITEYKDHEIVKTVEYDYSEGLLSVVKKTVKEFKGSDEHAEKTYYHANGKPSHVCNYLNGELTDEVFYDENGNILENGGDTVE